MVNAMKLRGDDCEREALAMVVDVARDLVVPRPMRQLGAGRADDIGDLRVFDDCVVQVKASRPSTLTAALRSAATGSLAQSANLGVPLGVGLTRLHNQSEHKWIATTMAWPVPLTKDQVTGFGTAVTRSVRHVRASHLVGLVYQAGVAPYLISSWDTWLAAYRQYRGGPEDPDHPVRTSAPKQLVAA